MKTKKETVVYRITNIINNKTYIGSAVCYETRKKRHINDLKAGRHHSSYLQRSFEKYGEKSFNFEIIEEVINTELLIETEQKWLDGEQPEYNMTLIAGLNSHLGMKRSEETKKKISEALTGIKRSEETKKKISDSQKGTSKDGTNMNKDKIGKALSDSHKKNIGLANKGNTHTKETKKKISETLKSKNLQSTTSIVIEKYDLDDNILEIYPSMIKAEKDNGIGRGLLYYHLIKKNRIEYKNFKWTLKNK